MANCAGSIWWIRLPFERSVCNWRECPLSVTIFGHCTYIEGERVSPLSLGAPASQLCPRSHTNGMYALQNLPTLDHYPPQMSVNCWVVVEPGGGLLFNGVESSELHLICMHIAAIHSLIILRMTNTPRNWLQDKDRRSANSI